MIEPSLNTSTSSSPGVLAEPLSVEGVADTDLEGHVPLEILQNGTRIVLPRWADPQSGDELWVIWSQNSIESRIFDRIYPAPIVDPFIYVDLTPAHMSVDGQAFLSYRVWKGGGGNPDDSPSRKLTINHAAPLELEEPRFPHATLWGYLNNSTIPPLTEGVTVTIPPAPAIALADDRNEVHWTGYRSLNGSGDPVPGTYGTWSRTLTLSDIDSGYLLVVPFEPHVQPLFDDDSAIVFCRLYRGERLIAMSKRAMVKLDRVKPGGNGPSGLNSNSKSADGVTKMAAKIQPPKSRINSTRSGIVTVDAAVKDQLADESIPVQVLDSGKVIFTATNLEDPLDNDELDFYYKVVGGEEKYQGMFEMGLVAGRPDPFEMELDASLFPESRTPAEPTRYEVRYELFKGGGGNADDSTVVKFAIDRTAPFEVKVPARKKNPPTPAVTITNQPAAPSRIVDEAWITANPQLLCEVSTAYPLRRDDDVLRYFLSSDTTVLKVFDDSVPASGAFEVNSDVLRQLPNGTRISHSYEWQDLPGNVSARSGVLPIFDLRLAQDPILLAPRVPKTDPDQSVHLFLDDFVTGAPAVLAVVEQPEHGIATDTIKLIIEDAADMAKFVEFGPTPLGTADVNFTLDYASLATLFADGTQPREVKVRYEHVRNGDTLDSPFIYIFLDFVHAGPVNPDLPDLTNPDLGRVTVTGDSDNENIITPGDRDKPGRVAVPAWFPPPNVVGGEQIDFYINSQFAGKFLPFGGETEFSAVISREFISALPTGTVKAYYTVKYVGSDNNIIRSPEQDVVVNARKIPLPEPTIVTRGRDEISCISMASPTSDMVMQIGIPKDENLKAGQSVTVHFVGVTDITGATEVAGTADSQTYLIKDAGTEDFARVGTPDKFKLNQPYRGAVAFGKYWYETDIGGIQVSPIVIKPFDIINTSFEYCDRLSAPPAP